MRERTLGKLELLNFIHIHIENHSELFADSLWDELRPQGAAGAGTLQLWLRNRNSRRAVKTGNGKVAKRKAEMAGTTQRNATEKCKFPRKGNYKNICWRRTWEEQVTPIEK